MTAANYEQSDLPNFLVATIEVTLFLTWSATYDSRNGSNWSDNCGGRSEW